MIRVMNRSVRALGWMLALVLVGGILAERAWGQVDPEATFPTFEVPGQEAAMGSLNATFSAAFWGADGLHIVGSLAADGDVMAGGGGGSGCEGYAGLLPEGVSGAAD